MKSLANHMSGLQVMVLAGTMFLAPLGAMAQQEVSPDIYSDNSPRIEQHASAHKDAKKKDTAKVAAQSKTRKDTSKMTKDRKLVAAGHDETRDQEVAVAQAK